MHQRAALQARENRRIQFLGDRLVVAEDQAAAGATQRFVRGGGRDLLLAEPSVFSGLAALRVASPS